MSMNVPPIYQSPLLEKSIQHLAQAGIELHLSKKRVKNINFRLKPHQLLVSVPLFISPAQAAQAVMKRVSWAIANHPQVLEQYKRQKLPLAQALTADSTLLL